MTARLAFGDPTVTDGFLIVESNIEKSLNWKIKETEISGGGSEALRETGSRNQRPFERLSTA